jgi:Spy/CpxP family protein refolding chaperone
MKKLIYLAVIAGALAGNILAAQQPAPQAPPRQPGPPPGGPPQAGQSMERRGPPAGFRLGVFSPTMLLERREALNLTPDQVTKLSTMENDLKTARDKAETDARPHREELQKIMEQSTPDVAQIRTHAQAMMQAEQTARLAGLTTSAQAKAVLTAEQRGRVQGWAESGRGGGPGAGRGRGMMFRRPGRGGPDGPQFRRRPMGFGLERGSGTL